MPLIRIVGEGGEPVYEGEGELIMFQSALGPRVEIRQTQRVGNEVRGRTLDIAEFLNAISPEWSAHRRVRPVPELGLDFSLDPPTMTIPCPMAERTITELRLSCPAESVGWLRGVLEQGFETAEERRSWHEARAEALSRAHLPMEMVREQMHPAMENAAQGLSAFREALREASSSPVLDRMISAEDRRRQYRSLVAEAFGLPEEIVYSDDDVRATLDTAVSRSAEHDRIIAEARAEFPHDPLDYGRVYPGDNGTSHWTPPDDPNEKIRSCP